MLTLFPFYRKALSFPPVRAAMRLVHLDEIPVPIHVTLKFHYSKFLADTMAKQNYLCVHVTLPSMDLKTKRCPHFTKVNMDNWNTELLQINPKSLSLRPCSQWESASSQLILGRPITTGATAHQGVSITMWDKRVSLYCLPRLSPGGEELPPPTASTFVFRRGNLSSEKR